jgi:hypothetical protein
MISVHPEIMKLPFKEFKELMKKIHPNEDAEKIYTDNGGKITKEKKEEK